MSQGWKSKSSPSSSLARALLDGRGLVGLDEVVEQAIDVLGRGGHAIFHHVVSVGLVAQELGQFAPQVDQPLADVEVALLALGAERAVGHEDLLAKVAAVGVHHEGTVARGVEGDDPALLALLAGSRGSSLAHGLGQSAEVGLVGKALVALRRF